MAAYHTSRVSTWLPNSETSQFDMKLLSAMSSYATAVRRQTTRLLHNQFQVKPRRMPKELAMR